ncbi:tripartite tricarboxylate transporter TctB family protein [Brevibacillus humidisoli]|uniref:tripartite tricarboxylate transporter TctB family protein n=1 Tax=Brevibacillus humidisoli TaxID=2895522 RepID=UPI001E478DEF|nr:tripartite tricarboxylate transporter TctB family protein [Brevibacillus humidisoli]UFJ42559.1 tripartite tricarboxylate transporter TctB family protein [Brevibacillus humidisoli]
MNKRFDRYVSIVFVLIGTFFIVESRNISASAYGSEVGPNLFPMGLGILLILISFRLWMETARRREEDRPSAPVHHKRLLSFVVITILYALTLEQLGYIISTFLFLFIGFLLMNKDKWWKSALIACCFSLVVYYAYVEGLKGTLPGWPLWMS